MNRYTVVGSAAECEPGSNGLVLRNRLGITDPGVMGSLEQDLLLQLYEGIFINGAEPHRLTVAEVIEWHRRWLEAVYPWAGKVRQFNLSKGNFAFASAHLLPDLLEAFQREQLNKRTPLDPQSVDELVEALAEVHVEFVLIHPFREGNGRIARLLADVMASQAGIGPLDYSAWDLQREQYFAAIRAGAVLNNAPMQQLFRLVLPGGGD